MRRRIDILHISCQTTFGFRANDALLVKALHAEGLDVVQRGLAPRYKTPLWRLARRSGPPVNDLVEAQAYRVIADRALAAVEPRCVIYSSMHAALLQPERAAHEGVWIDGPIALTRPEPRNMGLRTLERRLWRPSRVALPMSIQHADALVSTLRGARWTVLHAPVDPTSTSLTMSTQPRQPAVPYGIMYAGSPRKKGLDIAVAAWAQLGHKIPLLVSGVTTDQARRYLGFSLPKEVTALGVLSRDEHRALVRGAAVYVSASRREEYGTAQLEALADGIPLAAVPSKGLVEPVAVLRQLDPALVATDLSPLALSLTVRRALELSRVEREQFSRDARRLMETYSYEAFRRRLRADVLPMLLGGG